MPTDPNAPKRKRKTPLDRRIQILEHLTIFQACFLVTFLSWALGGEGRWVTGVTLGTGAAGLVVIIAHLKVRRKEGRPQTRPFLALAAPGVAFALLCVAAAVNPSTTLETVDGARLITPQETLAFVPTSARPERTAVAGLVLLSCHLVALNVYFVPLRRRSLRLLLGVAAANAIVLALAGFLQRTFGEVLGAFGGLALLDHEAPPDTYFARFVDSGHWAAFGTLWTGVLLGLALSSRRRRSWVGLTSMRLRLTAAAGVVALAVVGGGDAFAPALIGLLGAGCLLQQAAARAGRRGTGNRRRRLATARDAILGLASAAAGIAWLFTATEAGFWEGRFKLNQDTAALIAARPVSGWGAGSFEAAYALSAQNDVGTPLPEHAFNDWLELVAETGFLGAALALALPLFLLIEFARRGQGNALSNALLITLTVVAAYAAVDFPAAHLAVAFSALLILVAAARYGEITARDRAARAARARAQSDAVDGLGEPGTALGEAAEPAGEAPAPA